MKSPSFKNFIYQDDKKTQAAIDLESILNLKNDLAINILFNLIKRNRIHRKYTNSANYLVCLMSSEYYSGKYIRKHCNKEWRHTIDNCRLTYVKVRKAIELLSEKKLITIMKGHNYTGMATRIFLSPYFFYRLLEDMDFSTDDLFINNLSKIARIYSIGEDRSSLELKKKFNFAFCRNELKEIIGGTTLEIESNLVKINSAFGKHNELFYERIFGNDTTKLGRFSAVLHRIPSKLRKAIFEKGGYIELDFKSFNINALFYHYRGHRYTGSDFYMDIIEAMRITDNKMFYRGIVKKASLCVFGNIGKVKATNSVREAFYREKAYKKGIEKDFIEAFEKVAYELKDVFYTEQFNWCQNVESSIVEKLSLEMIKDNLLPWMIHDCIY